QEPEGPSQRRLFRHRHQLFLPGHRRQRDHESNARMMLLRRVLTYRLTLYYLVAILLAALILSAIGIVHQPPVSLVFSAVVALLTCLGVNWAFARVFGTESNWESACISALIIALIITPCAPGDLAAAGFLVLVSAWAMASKYMIAIGNRHL